MRIKNMIVCDAVHIKVDCAINNPADIRTGCAAVLGYDFYVSPDQNITKLITKIKKLLKQYNRPLMEISRCTVKDYNVEDLWTPDRIEQYIKIQNVC